jgi:hypothetical protein
MNDVYKLTIELVPQTIWFQNIREAMGRTNWDKLRLQVYADYGHKCGICGVHPNRLECHEMWVYDDVKHIQYLKGFIALCVLCHNIKHIGLSQMKADEGMLDYEEIVNHFMKVNNCSRQDFELYRSDAFAEWEHRSIFTWKQDFGKYKELIK